MRDEPRDDRAGRAVVAATSGAEMLAGIYVTDPFMALGIGAIAPAVKAAALGAIRLMTDRQSKRAEAVLVLAAQLREMTVEDLVSRMQESPEGEELLTQTLRAASEAALANKLYALALALGGAVGDGQTVPFETLFVRALGDCDHAHVVLLECFTLTSNQLGLGDGTNPDFDVVPTQLNAEQLKMARPDLAALLEPLVAVLQRHGLVVPAPNRGSRFMGGGGAPSETWELSPHGRLFIQRLAALADLRSSE